MTRWENIINAVVLPRARGAAALGVELEELRGIARLAAFEAHASWTPGAGSSETSWIWTHVAGRVSKALYKAGRELVQDTPDQEDGTDLEAEAIIRQSLAVLQARLDPDDYRLLWLYHALGCEMAEIARLYGLTYKAVQKRVWRARQSAVSILGLAA